MIDLTEDQMLGMARIAGLHIPDEDVVPLTLRLNALLEASEALDQFPLEAILALPTLPHTSALPVHQRDARGAPRLATETDAPLAYKPITELAHLIRTRHLSLVELTDLYLERIGQYNGALKSYITVVPESARREAQEAERALKRGADVGPLHRPPTGATQPA
jgi:hypothetical protein